jgi:hypothetical protein
MRMGIVTLAMMFLAWSPQALSQQLVGIPAEVTNALDANVALMNKQAPIEINPLQTMTHVSRNGGTILYSIETSVLQARWSKDMLERPSRETTKVMCEGKETRLLLDYGFQMRYLITDKSGLYVTSFVISKDKCV